MKGEPHARVRESEGRRLANQRRLRLRTSTYDGRNAYHTAMAHGADHVSHPNRLQMKRGKFFRRDHPQP